MSTIDLSSLLSRIEADSIVTLEEINEMRRCVFGDNSVSVVEADALLRINENCNAKPAEWSDFFVSAITDFLVRQTLPRGHVDEANAAWLMQRINHDGLVETHTEMALLMNVLRLAENVTPRLEMFALDQVKQSVLHGNGILARGAALKAGVIGEAEVEMLRAVLYACGGDGGSWITRAEAEVLFDLSDATANADNHRNWQDLFCAAIANHLMMLSSPAKIDPSEALKREEWLSDSTRNVGMKSLTSGLANSFKAWKQERSLNSGPDFTEFAQSERVTESEAAWLIQRLNRDGQLTDNEKALLRFLRDDCPKLHDSLSPYIQAAA